MRLTDLLTTCRRAGIILTPLDEHIDVDAPVGKLTHELRGALRQYKPDLLEVLWRLQGMSRHRDPVPTAKSAGEAAAGPGCCFSCGGLLDHPEAYGRCTWCSLAVEVFYSDFQAMAGR